MSIRVPVDTLDPKMRQYIYRNLRVREKSDPHSFFRDVKEIQPFIVEDGHVMLPFQWALQKSPAFHQYRPERTSLPAMSCRFVGKLREQQIAIQTEALAHLNKKGSIVIAVYPGGGKTITSLSMCSKVRLKTLVLVNRVVLMKQWEKSIQSFFDGAKVQILETKCEMNPDTDFYIMNALNVPKRRMEDFKDIGLVIVDECHIMITQVFVRALCYVFPRYLIGLSATPFRFDGLDELLDIYFGTERVSRSLYHRHTVYMVNTGIEIEGEFDERDKLIWNSVLHAQMTHDVRNLFIKRLCLFFENRKIMILCKRISQINTLHDLLSGHVKCTTLKASETTYDEDARVMIASVSKVGVGFSHDSLDMLILACDLEAYFLQYLGRVFRRPDVVPIIIDLVDKNPVLQRHFRTRKKTYLECGGSIYDFNSIFPDISFDADETTTITS